MQIWPCRKKVKDYYTIIIWINLKDLESPMLYTNIQFWSIFGSGKEVFYAFYYIWARRPTKLMDRDHLNKFTGPY